MLTRIESDDVYGRIEDPEYLLYNVHPALRNYLQKISDESGRNLEFEYGEKHSKYYYNLVWDTYSAIGKKDEHLQSLARFNIIFQGETNDFDKAVEVTSDQSLKAEISRGLSQILSTLGIVSKAFEYGKRSLEIHKQLNNRVGLAGDYANIGNVLTYMGRLEEALDNHNKALEIDNELNDRVGLALDYKNIGVVLTYMGRFEEALDNHNKALEIDKGLNDRVGLAGDYFNISFVLSNTSKEEALKSLYNALTILQEFEKENNYHHPLIEQVNSRISYLKEEE